ncbi:hypothetical protein [Streptomyces sp. NBC_00724]|uniref:hypothetical protein n=1 Tax=Streptomyces sp. NBC_00724 TaxID=2975812 RepID=UPI002ED1B145|nr:hypothetical protein OHB17_01005 [Streptomyces sp. NBC_00724]
MKFWIVLASSPMAVAVSLYLTLLLAQVKEAPAPPAVELPPDAPPVAISAISAAHTGRVARHPVAKAEAKGATATASPTTVTTPRRTFRQVESFPVSGRSWAAGSYWGVVPMAQQAWH